MLRLLRLLRALRPFLTLGWLLGTCFAVGFLAIGADPLRIVLTERHASVLSCAAWSRRAPRPAWVQLHGCQLQTDQRMALKRSHSFRRGEVLVPLTASGGSALPVAYVLLPSEFDRDPSRLPGDLFEGLVHPLSRDRASTAHDRSLPVLHLDEPAVAPLALSVIPMTWLLIAFGRRLRRNLRAVDAQDRLAAHTRVTPAASVTVIDISPLLQLRRALRVSAPCWMFVALVAAVASDSLLPFPKAVALGLGSAAALAMVGGGLFLWQRGRPSRVAMAASIAPIGVVVFCIVDLFNSSNTTDRLLLSAIAAYGVLATVWLARALARQLWHAERARLLAIEREWLWTKRQARIRLMPAKAPAFYVLLHVLGLVLSAITALAMAAAGIQGFVIAVALGVFFAFRARAQRHALPNAEEALANDARTPVLYLRSFLDEDLVVHSRSYRHDRSISEWVAAQFNLVGPVTAIARPGERLPQIGPYRIELPSHGDWQAEVRARIERSAAIVLVFGMTRGLLWELGQIADSGALPRTCFVFPPVDSLELDERWHQIDEHVAIVPQLQELRAIDPHHLLMARIGHDGHLTVLCSRIRTSASYEMAFAEMWLRHGLGAALPAVERPVA